MDVPSARDIRDRHSLESWLSYRQAFDRGISTDILIKRTILRLLPIAFSDIKLPSGLHKSYLIQLLRACVALAVTQPLTPYATDELIQDLLRSTTRLRTNEGFNTEFESDLSAAIQYAVRHRVFPPTKKVYDAASVINLAADALAQAYGADDVDYTVMTLWNAVAADADALESELGGLSSTKLWLFDPPSWWSHSQMGFTKTLVGEMGAYESWQVWIDWYTSCVEGRLPFIRHNSTSDNISLRIANGDNRKRFWDRPADTISIEIANWVEEAAYPITLLDAQKSNTGNIWVPQRDHFKISSRGEDADWSVASESPTVFEHSKLLERLRDFEGIANDVATRPGWESFESAHRTLKDAVDCPTQEIPEKLYLVYDATLAFASFLEFDNDLRRFRGNHERPLSAGESRKLVEIVRTAAPWIRRFPSARNKDEEAGQLLYKITAESTATHLALANNAFDGGLIGEADRDLIRLLITALDRSGAPAEKAGLRGIFTVKNMIYAIAGVAMTLVGDAATETRLYEASKNFLTRHIDRLETVIRESPTDVQAVLNRYLQDIRDENSGNEPNLPAAMTDGATNRSRRQRPRPKVRR